MTSRFMASPTDGHGHGRADPDRKTGDEKERPSLFPEQVVQGNIDKLHTNQNLIVLRSNHEYIKFHEPLARALSGHRGYRLSDRAFHFGWDLWFHNYLQSA